MAGAKQLVTLGLSWFRPGAVRPAGVCSGHYIALHRGVRRGGIQARRERRSGLQVPEVLIEASANIVVKTESVQVIVVRRPVRLGHCPVDGVFWYTKLITHWFGFDYGTNPPLGTLII
jgi:hypothetical protein